MEKNVKLSVVDTRYFINPAKHSVTCKMKFVVKYPMGMEPIVDYCSTILGDRMFGPDFYEVTTTAHVHPHDKWDEKVGVSVARAKAESMAYKRVRRMLERVYNYITYTVSHPIQDFEDKALEVEAHNAEYISQF